MNDTDYCVSLYESFKSKDKLLIIDICDQLKYGIRHGDKRKEIYKSEKINYTLTDIVEK